jgi:hypothetical protein
LFVKENYEHALDFALHFPLEGLLLYLRVINVNPAVITDDNPGKEGCTVGGDAMKLLADTDMLLLLISCQKSFQARYMTQNKKAIKINTSTQLHEILYIDSEDMLVLSSTIALHYYSCCTDSYTSPGNCGYLIIL